jgi:putative redox protein
MHAIATWKGGYQTVLEDGRGHSIPIDLPLDEAGRDTGTSALELNALSLAGCIVTIFALVAKKRRLPFEAMTIDLEAQRPEGAPTITSVEGTFRIITAAPVDAVETTLNITLRTCPVGVLYDRAHIPVRIRPIVIAPEPALLGAAP